MKRVRVIPILLLSNNGLVKTVNFKNPRYIGDPINAVKIFNEKKVDEIIILDIDASKNGTSPNYAKIEEIASECFMPLSYGGGIKTLDEIKIIFTLGVEKVIINTAIEDNPDLITKASKIYGSQSIVASIDYKKNFLGKYLCFSKSGKKKVHFKIDEYVEFVEKIGAGEIMLTSIEQEGTFRGYDYQMIEKLSSLVNIPVIANGGASSIDDFLKAINCGGASAVAAGSLFVYKSQNKGVLINYPSQEKLKQDMFQNLK